MNELILVVDDEPKIVKLVRESLEAGGFRVFGATDAASALTAARRERPDLVVMDFSLPDQSGADVCRALRHETDVPIIMLTSRSEDSDQCVGLGVDDFIRKPFVSHELLVRVQVVLSRVQSAERSSGLIRICDLEIDVNGYRVLRRGQPILLTRSEFNLLAVLAQNPGKTFTRDQLLNRLYGVAHEGYVRSIDAHIKNLRQKLEFEPTQPRYVLTVYRVGYRFVEDC
jgi:DNA-binding response OmpR family regulator